MEEYRTARQATDDLAHAHCIMGKQRLQTHTKNMLQLLLFHSNNGCTNAPECYVIHKLPLLLLLNEHSLNFAEELETCNLFLH